LNQIIAFDSAMQVAICHGVTDAQVEFDDVGNEFASPIGSVFIGKKPEQVFGLLFSFG
jgi:hypothetical protein